VQDIAVIDAKVLVLGGGFGGVWAALRAAELTDGVVLVEKAVVSRSGASTMSGGVTTCPLPGDDLDEWAAEFITRGGYMCDQDWTAQLLDGQMQRVSQLSRWGVPISRDSKGDIRRFSSRGMVAVRCMQYKPKAAMEELRRQAVARGVRIIDRLCMTELLTTDGEYPTRAAVAGAFCFDVRSGGCVTIRASRTVLATGGIAMKGTHNIDNVTCDGVSAAIRAGARAVDLEFSFGGTFSKLLGRFNFGSYNVAVAHGARLINARGQRFMERYDPVRFERSELSRVVAAYAKEMLDGRGPVYVDLRQCDESYWHDLAGLQSGRGASILLSDQIPDPRTNPLAIEPTWGLWNGGRGGLKIDLHCHSSLAGLLAAGVASKNDATGTHASAGIPTAYAMNSGWHAGDTAAREAVELGPPVLPNGLLAQLQEAALAPLARPPWPLTADDIHDELSRLEGSAVDTIVLNEAKLHGMALRAAELRTLADRVTASDTFDLVKVHEARNVSECARAVYLSALDRTESREQFYREDYPLTDDSDWFCWHGATQTADGELRFDRERIPFERFRLHPPSGPREAHPSPIAAIMNGTFDPAVYA